LREKINVRIADLLDISPDEIALTLDFGEYLAKTLNRLKSGH
jgi:hypothetical protein